MGENVLKGKKIVVLGASRGVGREIVRQARAQEAAEILAVARGQEDLHRLAEEIDGIRTLALDASRDEAPQQVFETLRPNVLIVCGGATPVPKPLHELSWSQFAATWDNDVRMSFLFCGQALRTPLDRGSAVILISSGAGIGGSPISGGYAGSKRMQMFMANYCQKESARLGLDIRFAAVVPMRIMPETELGRTAAEGYARYLGIAAADFIAGMRDRQSARDVANAVIRIAASGAASDTVVGVSSQAVSPIS